MLCRATEWKEGDIQEPSSGIHRSLAMDFDAVYQGQHDVLSRAAAPMAPVEEASSSMHGPCMETLLEDADEPKSAEESQQEPEIAEEPEPEMESAEEPEPSSGVCGPMPLEVLAPEPSVHGSEAEDLLQVEGEAFDHQQQVELRQKLQEKNRARGGGRGRSRGRGRGRGRKAPPPSENDEENEELVTPNARGAAVPEETPMDKACRTKRGAASEEPVEPKPKRAKAAAKKGAAKRMMKRPAAARRIAEEQPVHAEAIVPEANGAEASMPDADGMTEPSVPEPLDDAEPEPRVVEPLADAEPEPRVPVPLAEEPEEAPMGGDGHEDVPDEVVPPRGRGRGRGRGAKGLSEENRKICRALVQHGRNYKLELYWTRSVIGVRQKNGPQVWSMSFKNLKVGILVANEIVSLLDRDMNIHGEEMTNTIRNFRSELEEQYGEVWP
ncbi:unnamed protein product [Symbiodinium sp. CCMP2592]|nr:unnamed protein product [Symbiodinium sp. CCMP2592]